MKTTLDHETLLSLVEYSKDTGVFVLKDSARKTRRKGVFGTSHDGYSRARILGNDYYMHRLAWFYVTGAWPVFVIDHIDGNRSNNKFSNLREATVLQNNQNTRSARKDSKTGVMGVTYIEGRGECCWRARIRKNGKRICIGHYASLEKAHEEYQKAKREMHEFFVSEAA